MEDLQVYTICVHMLIIERSIPRKHNAWNEY